MFNYKKPLVLAPHVEQKNDKDDLGMVNVRLSADQIEEIHADEYTFTLFFATRMQPMKLEEIEERFPSPDARKTKVILERFVELGLIHLTAKQQYYTNYPNNYINFSNFRYDEYIEARKDSKVFFLMKKFTGVKKFWKDKTYFSIDAFFSDEQSKELHGMFNEIRKKAKQFENDNLAKKNIEGLKFRRLKFYDIFFPAFIACVMLLSLASVSAFAGNDPTASNISYQPSNKPTWQNLTYQSETTVAGNDPSKRWDDEAPPIEFDFGHDPTKKAPSDVGHDPTSRTASKCAIQVNNKVIHGNSPELCRTQELVETLPTCGNVKGQKCQKQMAEINYYLDKFQKIND